MSVQYTGLKVSIIPCYNPNTNEKHCLLLTRKGNLSDLPVPTMWSTVLIHHQCVGKLRQITFFSYGHYGINTNLLVALPLCNYR